MQGGERLKGCILTCNFDYCNTAPKVIYQINFESHPNKYHIKSNTWPQNISTMLNSTAVFAPPRKGCFEQLGDLELAIGVALCRKYKQTCSLLNQILETNI